MSKKEDPQETMYTSDVSELTGLTDIEADRLQQESESKEETGGIWNRLKRLVYGAPAEEHDKGRALRRAVRSEDINAVRKMIADGYGVNEAQEASLICIAARRTNLEMLKLLVEAGVEINKPDRRSQTSKARTALQEASRKGWVEGVEFLLELNVNVDDCEEGDATALHIAARMGHEDVVRLLLRNRADPCGAKNSITSPLHETSSLNIMRMLLQAGASVNQRDRNKCTPLHLQVYSGRPELAKMLIENGAEVQSFDRKGRTPAFLLGSRGDVLETYELLKEKGLQFGIKDLSENNLAHAFAQRTNSLELLEKLFEDAPELWTEKNQMGQTALDILNLRNQQDWYNKMDRMIDSASFYKQKN